MESQQIALSCNDEFIASIIINSSENPQNNESLMSDDDFAQELQLQEVIISSLINLQSPNKSHEPPKTFTIEIGESSKTVAKEEGGGGESSQSLCEPPKTSTIEIGESSKKAAKEEGGGGESWQSLCEICAEKKDGGSMFPLRGCAHSFCKDCISRHISIKVRKRAIADAAAGLACPGSGCGGTLDAAACRAVVPSDVGAAWDEVLCESAIAAAERVYCPYKNCSALLVDDGVGGVIREAECPFCRRLFCASCGVPWHAGVDCEGFAKLREDEREREDLMVHKLAKENKWKRCFKCHFFVERNEGCLHMTCRCGCEFCYACGGAWSSTHAGCQ